MQGYGTSWLEIHIINKRLVEQAVDEFRRDVIDPDNIPSEKEVKPTVGQSGAKLSTCSSSRSLVNKIRESPEI